MTHNNISHIREPFMSLLALTPERPQGAITPFNSLTPKNSARRER